jgi:hypothetical protein
LAETIGSRPVALSWTQLQVHAACGSARERSALEHVAASSDAPWCGAYRRQPGRSTIRVERGEAEVVEVDAAAGILILVLVTGGYVAYGSWLTSGIRPRVFTTSLSAAQLRLTFGEKVARAGWKIVDDGNPMVAQSPLATGIRQQIALDLRAAPDGSVHVRVGPRRWVSRYGVPKKGHTIRMRLDSFVNAVQRTDPAVAVTRVALRGR